MFTMRATADDPPCPGEDRLLEIEGTVQGVGFRPFVARLATRFAVRGWVRNDGRGVCARIAGPADTLDRFVAALRAEAPPAARITSLRVQSSNATAAAPEPPVEFVIADSDSDAPEPTAAVTPDLAICTDCRRELSAPEDRRHHHPFINCTNCGPRYSIVEALPFDRARTTMAHYKMCPECAREFVDPGNRRYHAQANACLECGPQVQLTDRTGRTLATRASAIAAAVDALGAGRIVAVKGIGGFHLMVDATDEAAVRELRRRKHREEKPLAVMFASLAALRAVAEVAPDEEAWLTSPIAPIVLVRRLPGPGLAGSIAPGNPYLGAMLPCAPLQVLLLDAIGRPLVATSGNLSEEPLCTDDAEARERLGAIADFFLGHDRAIARPVDDSILRRSDTGPVVLRRARGLAPAPLPLPPDTIVREPLLCVGGHLKNTIAVTVGDKLVLSPHLGDLGNPISVAAFRRAVELMGALHGGRFARVVCDAHPDYASTRFAESLGLPVVRVQHHLAHILACLLEHGGGPERVLGIAWDGTGDGGDGSIWGGEFIIVDRAARTAERVAHLRAFRLPGGEAAVREPRRSALGILHELFDGSRTQLDPLAAALGFADHESAMLASMIERGVHAPLTTSAGRLFDAAASLLGLCQRSSFEGQAAMQVEYAAASAPLNVEPWPLPIIASADDAPWQLDWRPAIAALLRENATEAPTLLAARFHASLAGGIAAVAARSGLDAVALSGGCFQNVRLLAATTAALESAGCTVLRHRELPPNDGGLAGGQALGALWGITSVAGSRRWSSQVRLASR